jgi:hypothetical protein
MARENTVLMEDARIIFRNFAGREGQYNREGDRNFCVLLPEDLATQLYEDGWNVKSLKSREPDDPAQPYLMVAVSFKGRPPKIVMITSKGRTDIPEQMIEMLDWVDIRQVDLIIRPYDWTVSGRGGRKAYLKSLFITIEEDALELKYADVREINARPDYIDAEVVDEMLAIEAAIPTRSGRITD